MSERGINAKETAAKLGVSVRTLERRHEWSPAFPQPLMHRPLVWREADVDAWIVRRSREAQRAA